MSETPDSVLPPAEERKCCKCCDPRYKNRPYCVRHYRFDQMRVNSKHRGKLVPSHEWLEANVPAGMVCPCCTRQMNWLVSDSRSTTISIQHDHDGGMRLICYSCNVRHASMPEDSFYALPPGMSKCKCCGEVKAQDEFFTTAGRRCRICNRDTFRAWEAASPGRDAARKAAWRASNPEKVAEINAARRARRKLQAELS